MTPRVSIVIPSWRGAELLARHLPAVVEQARNIDGGAEVLVVDDGSDRDGGRLETEAFGLPVHFIAAPVHRGFANTANHGAREARGEVLILWNNDMHPKQWCLSLLIDALHARPDCFAVVPRIELPDTHTESATRLVWKNTSLHAECVDTATAAIDPRPVAWPCGGAMACLRERFVALGGFSLRYEPFYWEDVDLGLRAWVRGFASLEIPTAHASHDHQATVGNHYGPSEIEQIANRNRRLFTLTHTRGNRFVRAWAKALAATFAPGPGRAEMREVFRRWAIDEPPERRFTNSSATRARAREIVKRIGEAGDAGWPSA
ncbi:MAG: GT2 family glycosyltransferase [Hyphomicrobiaceae bacterium]